MGEKGMQTRKVILAKAYGLFARKGFKEVTMKDICTECGLSRGGLYRHFSSTANILETIFEEMSASDNIDFFQRTGTGENAVAILDDILVKYEKEMLDSANSLSLAIYEYSQYTGDAFWAARSLAARDKWNRLIQYGIDRGEFKPADPGQITDLILYAYQGARMWSTIFPLPSSVPHNIITVIRNLLVP